jgi:iron complex outermembrane receptor protein
MCYRSARLDMPGARGATENGPLVPGVRRQSPLAWPLGLLLLLPARVWPQAPVPPPPDDTVELTALSLDELMSLKVTTVSRKPEPWWSAPSGVDVVTGDDIRRSGAVRLPDALRLATGVHVGQPSARSWAVSIRGMNVLAANKISASTDGRSLFTPFFSGVQWDVQEPLLEDVDRIEVVRGPVGALWGAYAVNGFIQVLTKPAGETPGLLVSVARGSEDPAQVAVRYGGRIGQQTAYRVYGKYFQTDWTVLPDGQHAQTATDFLQGGFRLDGRRPHDTTVSLHGDFYTNDGLPLDHLEQGDVSGLNLVGRWKRARGDASDVALEAYFDRTHRVIPLSFEERRNTGAVSAKYRFGAGRQSLVVGGDLLVSGDRIGNMGIAQLQPAERVTHTAGVYVQDTLPLHARASLVGGAKVEHSSFAGYELQPSLRFVWTPDGRSTAWAAVSRALRTPVRVDEDLVIRLGSTTFFEANDDFDTETALAWEAGLRRRLSSGLTLDLSAFVYRYDPLRSTEPGAPGRPATFRNSLAARSSGAEAAMLWHPVRRVLVKGSYRFLDLRFSKDPGSGDTTGGRAEGNDPKHVAVATVRLDLPGRVELDGVFRLASRLPNPPLPGYETVDARLAWRATRQVEVALSGRNLLDAQHAEFVTTNSLNELVRRSALLTLTWRR